MRTIQELADLITQRDEAWGEFMRTNETRLKAIEEGEPTTELMEKLERINTDMAEIRVALEEVEAAASRPNIDPGETRTEDQIEHARLFGEFLRKGTDVGLHDIEIKAMNTGSDPDGGYLVLPEMDMEIDRVAPTISAMHRLADSTVIGSSQWTKLMKTAGMALAWVADGGTSGETTEPKYAKVAIDVHTGEVEPWVFNETLEDAFVNLEADLADEAAIGFAEGTGAAFITGNGVGRPRGIMAYDILANASYAWGSVGYIASGKSAAFTSVAPADAVINLQHALKSQYRPGAVFLTNDSTLGIMRQFKDASGTYYLWNPDPTAGFGGRFLGNPVEIDDNIASLAAGSLSLAFGNFKRAYQIVNRTGVSLIRDNITLKGQTKFNFRKRVGGGIKNFEALKLMKFATT